MGERRTSLSPLTHTHTQSAYECYPHMFHAVCIPMIAATHLKIPLSTVPKMNRTGASTVLE